jgi:hypothetical protein
VRGAAVGSRLGGLLDVIHFIRVDTIPFPDRHVARSVARFAARSVAGSSARSVESSLSSTGRIRNLVIP